MSGGIYAKLGQWFERDYVCLQWLLMLLGTVDEVTWEPLGDDERGVDVRVRRGHRLTAVQCKTRARGNWSGDELAPIIEHALYHLAPGTRVDEFRFVHDGIAALPLWLGPWAGRDGLAACAPETQRDRLSKLGRIVTTTADRTLLARCLLSPVTQRDLEQQLLDHAHALVTEPRRLLEALTALRDRDVLGLSLDAIGLKSRFDASSFEWRHPDPVSVAQAAHQYTQRFVEASQRLCLNSLPRPEPGILVDLICHNNHGCVVLVHGAPGIGKSTVIANAVSECQSRGQQVLAFSAVELEAIQKQKLLPQQLAVAWSDEHPRIICIDQIDQVSTALAGKTVTWRDVHAYIRSALERRMTVVLGARTVDVLHAALLRELTTTIGEWTDYDSNVPGVQGDSGASPVRRNVRLQVQPLTEAVVAKHLEARHIAYFGLPLKTRALVRNPLALTLFGKLFEKNGWRGARTIHELVGAWVGDVLDKIPGGRDTLDAVFDAMAHERVARLEPIELPRPDAVAPLVEAGVLLEQDGWLRPVHQALLDAHVGYKLGSLRDVGVVIERIGPRDDQGVLAATQLRLAVARWARRATHVLDQLYRSPELRPFSRFGLLLGLADEPDAPSSELGDVITGWLRDDLDTAWIAQVVLHGRGTWVHSVRPWLERAWRPNEPSEGLLIGLLASVSVAEGDLVAEILTAWAARDPDVLRRARVLFFQSPAKDTDRLFELRTSDLGLFAEIHTYVDWPALTESHPARAVRCLALLLATRTAEEWVGVWDAAQGSLPHLPDLRRISEARPGLLWAEMRDLWHSLEIGDIGSANIEYDEEHRSQIGFVVEVLGQDLALLVDRRELDWDTLGAVLPKPLRTIDRWLLVEVASAVETQAAADQAWQWIEAELVRRPYRTKVEVRTRRRELSIGDIERFSALVLARRVARHLATRTAPEHRARIEAWCEELGYDASSADMGAGLEPVTSGYDAAELRSWKTETWIEELRDLSGRDGTLERTSRGWSSRDIDFLSLDLNELVGTNPSAHVSLALAILDAEPPIDERVLTYLVHGICRLEPPPGLPTAAEWLPLSDEVVAQVVGHERVLTSDRCAVDVARIIIARAAHPWPARVIERLVTLASVPTQRERGIHSSTLEGPLDLTRALHGAPSALAVEALAAVVRHQPALRLHALRLAADLCRTGPNHRRLAAVRLAAALIVTLGRPAAEAVLAGCDELAVAAHPDGLHAVRYTVDQFRDEPAIRGSALRLMESLCASPSEHQQRAGGQLATVLRWRGLVAEEQLACLLRRHWRVRLGAADVLNRSIGRGQAEPWMFELALSLANDEEDDVIRAALDAVTPDHRELLELPERWLERLTDTRAMRRRPDEVFELAARHGDPRAVADLVVRGAQRFIDDQDSVARTRREVPWRSAADAWCSRLAQVIEAESWGPDERPRVARAALAVWERFLREYPHHTVTRSQAFVG